MASIQSILNKISDLKSRTGLFSIQKSEFFGTLTDITNKISEVNDNVNSVAKSLLWQEPVISIVAILPTTGLTISQRYILSTDNKIYTATSTTAFGAGVVPESGWAAMITSLGFIFSYNGISWNSTGLKAFPTDVLTIGYLFDYSAISTNEKAVLPYIKNIILRGITDAYRLTCVINSAQYPYRTIWRNSAEVETVIDFGANIPVKSAALGIGSVEITIDWVGLGLLNFNNGTYAASNLSVSKRCYQTTVPQLNIASPFTVSPTVPTPTTDLQVANKKFVDDKTILANFANKTYLLDINQVLYTGNTANRAAFLGVLDIWFEGITGTIYENYDWCLYYIGQNHATYKNIWWMGRRATSISAWETITITTNGTTYFPLTNELMQVSTIWNGVTIQMIVAPSLLGGLNGSQTALLKKSAIPTNEFSKLWVEHNKVKASLTSSQSDMAVISSNQQSILGNNLVSPNYSFGRPDILGRLSYYAGHTFATDIATNIDAPVIAGFKTKTDKIAAFSPNAGDPNFWGHFNVDMLALMKSYDLADGVAITPITMKCKVYNSHATSSANVTLGFRAQKNAGFYLPIVTATLAPGEAKVLSVDFVMSAGERWSIVNTYFDIYSNATSAALSSDPAWIYWGEMDLYFTDPKGRVLRPLINPAVLQNGIKEYQLDSSVVAKLNGSSLSGKTVAVLGDSIMMLMNSNAIVGSNYDLQNWDALKTKLGLTDLINLGLGGATVGETTVYTNTPHPDDVDNPRTTCISNEARWLKRLTDAGRAIPDAIMIWVGTNGAGQPTDDIFDATMAIPWDTLSDDVLGAASRRTFYGGLRYTIESLYRNYQYATIFVFSPIQTNPADYRTYAALTTTRNALKRMSDRYACVFCDALNEIGIVDLFEKADGTGYWLGDGLHPKAAGKIPMKNYASRQLNSRYFPKKD